MLDADELAASVSLLDYPDNTFLDVVTARIEAPSADIRETKVMQRLLAKLRDDRFTNKIS
jgi:succinate dehydrogenase flavin-adding protein (antitoxin of CptAB toxin-antitoxin module)